MTGRGLGYCILRCQGEVGGADIRGYAGLRGTPVNTFSRDHLVNVKPGINSKLTELGLVKLKQRAQDLTRELSRLRERISELENKQ
jgi:hypothetical protein